MFAQSNVCVNTCKNHFVHNAIRCDLDTIQTILICCIGDGKLVLCKYIWFNCNCRDKGNNKIQQVLHVFATLPYTAAHKHKMAWKQTAIGEGKSGS